ncbi:MAG: NAD(+) diphosphatase [Rhizobiaceae bacterium]|nr:NAD(+) diphosphatase [Rhizobiaceae bacterium]
MIDFDTLPSPEPSSLVGFSNNRLVRDAENRNEETIHEALDASNTRYFMFSRGQVLLKKTEVSEIRFEKDVVEKFTPQFEKAILLGNSDEEAWVAVPCKVDIETLKEPWTSYDLRSLLYSASVSEEEAGAIAQAGSMLYWHVTNRFCGKCGTPSESMIGGYRRDCPNCGHKIFPRTDPVVIMLPIQGERCVMGRSPHFPPGWFSTLAGFVEPGETIEDAMRRETFEESGVHVGRVKYHASQPWPFPHSLMIGLYGEVTSNEINMDESELEDCRWFTREEVKLMIREEHPDGFICPPNKAISSALIRYWAED